MFWKRAERRAARASALAYLRSAADQLAEEHSISYIGVDDILNHRQLPLAFDALVDAAGDEEPPGFWQDLGRASEELARFPNHLGAPLPAPRPASLAAVRRRLAPPREDD